MAVTEIISDPQFRNSNLKREKYKVKQDSFKKIKTVF